jgi:hypothetical protein
MALLEYNHGKFFAPVQIYSGYFLMAGGLIAVLFSFTSIILIISGAFLAYTSSGTVLDTENKRVKPYTNLFGIIKTGKWLDMSHFTRFNIIRTTKKYTTYSRGSVRFDMNVSDIQLRLINDNNTRKVIINRYNKMEEAQEEKEKLSRILYPSNDIIIEQNAITG